MSPSRRSSSPSFSLVAAAVAVRNSLKMNRLTYVPTGGWSRRGRDHPRKHHVRSQGLEQARDRKSTRLNSSHGYISYAVFCLKKKKKKKEQIHIKKVKKNSHDMI